MALANESASPPISTLGYATAPRDQTAVFGGGALVQRRLRRLREQTLGQEIKQGGLAEELSRIRCEQQRGNRKIAKTFFCINGLCPWCARSAHAFVVISSGYPDHLRNKVHFEPKSAFEGVTLRDPIARTRACKLAGKLPGFERASDRRRLIPTSSGCSRPYPQSRACDQLLRPAR